MSLVTSLSLLIGLILLVTKTVTIILKLDKGKFGGPVTDKGLEDSLKPSFKMFNLRGGLIQDVIIILWGDVK
jgi:hypothetical protein